MDGNIKITDLIEIFLNEKNTPEILLYQSEILNFFYSKLKSQKEDIKSLNVQKPVKNIYELEIDRIEYLIREYILTRLDKMKKNLNINMKYLSEKEKMFYNAYKEILAKNNIICNEAAKQVSAVGFICKENLGKIFIDEESVDMFKDDFFVGLLSDIEDLVNDRKVYLL